MVMLPSEVNLKAFVTKFSNTWYNLFLSLVKVSSGKSSFRRSSTCGVAFICIAWNRSLQSCFAFTFSGIMSKVPASIFDKSRISEISWSNSLLLSSMIVMYWCFSSWSSASSSILEKPIIALSGVRISWLMLARKADFKRSASSALSLALISICSVSFSCVMSKLIHSISMMLSCGR